MFPREINCRENFSLSDKQTIKEDRILRPSRSLGVRGLGFSLRYVAGPVSAVSTVYPPGNAGRNGNTPY